MIHNNGNKFIFSSKSNIDSIVSDQSKLSQVLINLLSNAAKNTANGEIRLEIEDITHNGGKCIKFLVKDTGIGMDEAHLTEIFNPFSQVDSTMSHKCNGTGLGLSISRKFCELMQGNIYAESTLGSGTTFTVILPQTATAQAI